MATTGSPTCSAAELPRVDGGQTLGVDVEDGEVGGGVAGDDGGGLVRAVGERHLDGLRPLDDVVVGHDGAVGVDHEAGAGPLDGGGRQQVLHLRDLRSDRHHGRFDLGEDLADVDGPFDGGRRRHGRRR